MYHHTDCPHPPLPPLYERHARLSTATTSPCLNPENSRLARPAALGLPQRCIAEKQPRVTAFIGDLTHRPGAIHANEAGDPAHPLPLVGGVAAGTDDDALAAPQPRAGLRSPRGQAPWQLFARRPRPVQLSTSATTPGAQHRCSVRAKMRRSSSSGGIFGASRSGSGAGWRSPRDGRRPARATRRHPPAREPARAAVHRLVHRRRRARIELGQPLVRGCRIGIDLGPDAFPHAATGGGGTARSARAARR